MTATASLSDIAAARTAAFVAARQAELADSPLANTLTPDEAIAAIEAGLVASGAIKAPGPGLTAQQVRWAAQHDWYVSASGQPHTGLTVHVVDAWTQDGDLHEEPAAFRDFAALRAWAGY